MADIIQLYRLKAFHSIRRRADNLYRLNIKLMPIIRVNQIPAIMFGQIAGICSKAENHRAKRIPILKLHKPQSIHCQLAPVTIK